MRIGIIGTGYVGLVSGACLADFGHDVVGFDTDRSKIGRLNRGNIPIYEPGLDEAVLAHLRTGRLSFVDDVGRAVRGADAVFIAVGTPARPDNGGPDLTFLFQAVDSMAALVDPMTVVVCKSTVPVGASRAVLARLRQLRPEGRI